MRALDIRRVALATLVIAMAGLLLTAMPVVAEAPGDGCVKIDTPDVGKAPQSVTIDGIIITITGWTLKEGETDEYIGFAYTVSGDVSEIEITYQIKGGDEDQSGTLDPAGGTVVYDSPHAISHVTFCVVTTGTTTTTTTEVVTTTTTSTTTTTEPVVTTTTTSITTTTEPVATTTTTSTTTAESTETEPEAEVLGIQVTSTTVAPATLPFTGSETEMAAIGGISLMGIGILLLALTAVKGGETARLEGEEIS